MAGRSGKFYFVSGLLVAVVSVSGCPRTESVSSMGNSGKATTTRPAAGHFAKDRAYEPGQRFSILPPNGYTKEDPTRDLFMKFLGPCEGNFTVNFNVSAQKDDGTPIEKAGPKVRWWMPFLLKDFHIVEEGLTKVAGMKAYYSSGTFKWEGKAVQNLQYFMKGTNGKVYIVTFAAPLESFKQHRTTFEQTAQTVLIK